MELRYIILTIIKILLSVPAILLIATKEVETAALIGEQIRNSNNSSGILSLNANAYATRMIDSLDADNNITSEEADWKPNLSDSQRHLQHQNSKYDYELKEKMPDPEALIVPGYNLPETIFNRGKPFYLEKDPVTGKVNFNSRTETREADEYEYYEDEDLGQNVFDKENIDRKDGEINETHKSHRPSDINQLTPNIHDFLNLPVKYNPDKHVYPLISSSYANTKVQGNVINRYNHKDDPLVHKHTTSPTYHYSLKTSHTKHETNVSKKTTKTSTSTTTLKPTTTRKTYTTTTKSSTTTVKSPATMKSPITTIKSPTTTIKLRITATKSPITTMKSPTTATKSHTTTTKSHTTTTKSPTTTTTTRKSSTTAHRNLMDSPMNHPSYDTEKNYTSEKAHSIVSKSNPTTKSSERVTKRPLTIFEHLFGFYDETYGDTEQEASKSSTTTTASPNRHKKKNNTKSSTEKSNNIFANILGGDSEYEYDDYYSNENDNVAVESNPQKQRIETTKTATYVDEVTQTKELEKKVPTTSTNKNTYITTEESKARDEYHSSTKLYSLLASTTPVVITTTPHSPFTTMFFETTKATEKVTSLPLGENHFGTSFSSPSLLPFSHDVKENVNTDSVPIQTYDNTIFRPIPSANNIRIAPHQDTVSFVVGNQQNVQGDNSYERINYKDKDEIQVGTSYQNDQNMFKESSTYGGGFNLMHMNHGYNNLQTDALHYTVQTSAEHKDMPNIVYPPQNGDVSVSTVKIQPIRTSETSLAIGVPIESVKKIPGQVVDENLENEKINFPKKGTGATIVFPGEDEASFPSMQKTHPQFHPNHPLQYNKEVLSLNSKPIFHQLPSDLTPPSETESTLSRLERPRPPWDPRPGHFHNGRPEYSRPPKPLTKQESYKRIDNLPNILPQFRPNIKMPTSPHIFDNKKNGFLRQPPPDRQTNKPPNFYEKLVPPAPPKNLHTLRKLPPFAKYDKNSSTLESNFQLYDQQKNLQINFHNLPPKPPRAKIANRRHTDGSEIETLQMIQAKNSENKDNFKSATGTYPKEKNSTQGPLYVVYPVNTSPIKLDTLDTDKKETVIVGTRAELPLPPSKIKDDFPYDKPTDRNDVPVLKPHLKPQSVPSKSDFPYPLEIPEYSTTSNNVPKVDGIILNNQWNTLDNSELNTKNVNEISASLKLFTEKPIAVAYTPTEPHYDSRFSMPNYDGSVISEIRNEAFSNLQAQLENKFFDSKKKYFDNHKTFDEGSTKDEPPKLDFQAPFQASINLDSVSHGWTVIRNKDKSEIDRSDVEVTATSIDTTTEFNIEKFKPQLYGGFKPIYEQPEENKSNITDRQER